MLMTGARAEEIETFTFKHGKIASIQIGAILKEFDVKNEGTEELIIACNDLVTSDRRFSLKNTSNGEFILKIANVTSEDSGMYSISESCGFGKKKFIKLKVIA